LGYDVFADELRQLGGYHGQAVPASAVFGQAGELSRFGWESVDECVDECRSCLVVVISPPNNWARLGGVSRGVVRGEGGSFLTCLQTLKRGAGNVLVGGAEIRAPCLWRAD
jgi:hypothetical protein